MRELKKEEIQKYIDNPSACPWCTSEDIRSSDSPDFDCCHGEWVVRCDYCGAVWVEQFKMLGIRWKATQASISKGHV